MSKLLGMCITHNVGIQRTMWAGEHLPMRTSSLKWAMVRSTTRCSVSAVFFSSMSSVAANSSAMRCDQTSSTMMKDTATQQKHILRKQFNNRLGSRPACSRSRIACARLNDTCDRCGMRDATLFEPQRGITMMWSLGLAVALGAAPKLRHNTLTQQSTQFKIYFDHSTVRDRLHE